jgi:hypothetical protein
MNRISVSSSNIASIGYDPVAHVLEIEFNDGSIYQYENVPQSEYDGLMSAASHGQYLDQHIKGVYSYRKIS